jgi:3-oxoacyl-[acyl-carrier protein] reductase
MKQKYDGFAFVTGGSRGIGAACCLKLAEDGYDIAVQYVSPSSKEKAEAVAEEARNKYGVKVVVVHGDVSKYADCKAAIEEAVAQLGNKIAVLVTSAGCVLRSSFDDATLEELDMVIDVDLKGTIYTTHLVVPYMKKQNYGAIITISSVAGVYDIGQPAYSAAKGGVVSLTKGLSRDYAHWNIRANCVAPGCVWTDMVKDYPEQDIINARKATPLGFIADPEEIADCVSYVAGAKFLTGEIISPNGGWRSFVYSYNN